MLAFLVWRAGPSTIAETMKPALVWLPLLVALELGRIASESLAGYLAYGSVAKRLPLGTLFRANLIGLSLGALAPAPRVVNETIKVTLLAPYIGAPVATSAGFTIQAATLMSVGLFSIPCGIAIYLLGGTGLFFWAAIIHAVTMVLSGLVIRAATRSNMPSGWLARRFPRLRKGTAAFSEHAREGDLWALGPTFALLGNRFSQVLQMAVAARAVGIDTGVVQALAAQGVNLIGIAVGVLVPGGLGAADGTFTLAADLLGTTVAKMTALALLVRCTQLIWLLIGSAFLLLQRTKVTREDTAPDP